MNKQTYKKKTIIWEGFTKELPWIIFWMFILLIAYGYYQDKKICEEILNNPCDACYKLNETLINIEHTINYDNFPEEFKTVYVNISINNSLLYEDKNPTSKSISTLK